MQKVGEIKLNKDRSVIGNVYQIIGSTEEEENVYSIYLQVIDIEKARVIYPRKPEEVKTQVYFLNPKVGEMICNVGGDGECFIMKITDIQKFHSNHELDEYGITSLRIE